LLPELPRLSVAAFVFLTQRDTASLEESPIVATTIHANWVHQGGVSLVSFCGDPNTPYLATCGLKDHMVFVIDLRSAPPKHGHDSTNIGNVGFRVVAYAHLPGTTPLCCLPLC
jgi:hypothetical protein